MDKFQDKVAFVTGGSKGIGYGVAEALARLGAKVAITSRHQDAAEQAAAAINKEVEGEVFGLQADVRDYQSQVEAVSKVVEKWGKLDVLVANAGVGHYAPIDEMEVEDWQKVIDTNLTGVFYSVKAALEELKKTEGYIFTISSLAGTNFFANGSAYNASKFGVTGFTQAIMLDLRYHGIKVSTIMPGSVATYFNEHTPGKEDEWKIQKEDIGELVVDLLKMHPRTLPSKVEVRPTRPPRK